MNQMCLGSPPGVSRSLIAITTSPVYNLRSENYHITPGVNGFATYQITGVTPDANTHALVTPGQIKLWAAPTKAQEDKIWKYLWVVHDPANAAARLQSIRALSQKIAWHEAQHRAHSVSYFEQLEKIINNPIPAPILIRVAPIEGFVHSLIGEARVRRMNELRTKHKECTDRDFHAYDYDIRSYGERLLGCACRAKDCLIPLPRPLPDFKCDFSGI